MNFSIFLSHHETETELAQEIRGFLVSISQKIRVHTYVQKAKADSDYRKWIYKAVGSANMFMFLYTDDTRELSWVAHELGLFLGAHDGQMEDLENKHPHSVVCIKSPDIETMPAVLSHIAPISATKKEIKILLQDFLVNGKYTYQGGRLANDPLSLGELQEKIDAQAEKIAGMFRSKIHTQFFADRMIFRNILAVPRSDFEEKLLPDYHVVLKLPDRQARCSKEWILDFSKVTFETSSTVRNNLLILDEWKYWGDIVYRAQQAKESGPSDRFDLAREILSHASSEHYRQDATSMMLAEIEIGGKIFLPIISRVEKRDRLPISYYLLVLPDPRTQKNEIFDNSQRVNSFAQESKLILLLKFARRFRWNLLEPFIWKIVKTVCSSGDLQPIFHSLQAALTDMEKEGEQNKLGDVNLAALNFEKEDRADLTAIWLKYEKLRGALDQAVAENDPKSVLEVLNKFQEMNRSFLETVLEQYKKVMMNIPILDESEEEWRVKYFKDSIS